MNSACVCLEHVSMQFTECRALQDINLEICEGEFFSLLGPSGCGKTTTLRILGGFLQPTEGKVIIDNLLANDVPPNLRNVNTVFQNYAIFPHMTVFENVAYPLMVKKVPKDERKQRVSESLDLVSMQGFENRYSNQLSGGQRQRVALARALILKPKVLLLDEPLGALDLQLRQQMQFALKQLQRELGITFIYVTHDQGEALTMSDRIAVMYQGELQQVGSPQEIYERPMNRFVAQFIGRTNFIEGTINSINGEYTELNIGRHILKCQRSSSFRKGDKACISIRPEKIVIGKKLKSMANVFSGNIRDIIYFGDRFDVIVNLCGSDDLVTVRVDKKSSHSKELYKIDDKVEIGWEIKEEVLLK